MSATAPQRTEQAASKMPTGRRHEWLTMEDFCAYLEVPLSSAYKWRLFPPEEKKFPRFCRLPNGKILIRRDWLEEWLDELSTPKA
jgi:helix-turn-helix protein